MSYTQVVTFRCDGCGTQVVRDSTSCPTGWMEPGTIFNKGAGPHLCNDCSKRAQLQPNNLVPVETGKNGKVQNA